MATMNGTIKRLTDKGFGFIAASDGSEYWRRRNRGQIDLAREDSLAVRSEPVL